MKENTYDVPAYKFSLYQPLKKINHWSDEKNMEELYESMRGKSTGAVMIPFENIDGLTLEEIMQVTKSDGAFAIICHTVGYQEPYYQDISTYHAILINPRRYVASARATVTIDKIVSSHFIRAYDRFDDQVKRFARCFLERYMYDSYETTHQKIKSIEQQGEVNL